MNVYQTFLEVLGEDNVDKDLVGTIKGTEVLEEEKKMIRIGQLIRKRRMEIGDDFMENYLDQWMYEGIYFVKTKGSEHIHSLIKDHKSLVVSGPSGVGKTASVRHVALQLENESYTIIFLRKPDDIKQYYKSGRKTLYVIDDLCGTYTGDKKQIKKWKKLENEIQYRLEHGNCKLIATCRLQVFQDIKSTDLSLFKNECNLISKGNNLTDMEVDELAKTYFQEAAVSAKEHLSKYECFPYLCKLYYDNKDKSDFCLQSFLENPFSFLAVELHNLKRGNGKNNKGKLRFCALVLLVISNDNLEVSTLEGKDPSHEQMIYYTLQKCELNTNITGKDIQSELDKLTGTFVIKRDQTYCAPHAKMFDFLALHMAAEEKLLDIIIMHASEGLVCERLSVAENPIACESLVCEQTYAENPEVNSHQIYEDCLITIPEGMTQMYIKRVFRDITTSVHLENYLSNNKNMKNDNFRKRLISYTREQFHNKDLIEDIICTASSDFISRIIAITPTVSVKSRISFTVQIPETYVHMYIERVFKDMTSSTNVEQCISNNVNQIEEAFNDGLSAYMAQIPIDEIESLLQKASADFVASIFVFVKNVNERGSPIDKFSILIPDEYLQKYIEKVYTDLIRADDIEKYLQTNRNQQNITFNEMLIAFMNKFTENDFRTLLLNASSSSIKRLIVVISKDRKQSTTDISMKLHKSVLQLIQDTGILNCPESCISEYIERIIQYWKIGEVFDVFENVNMKNPFFADLLINHLHSLDKPTQLQLAAVKDNKTTCSTLVVSCHTGYQKLANWCLQNKVDVNSCDDTGGSPLYIASWKNYPEIVSLLLSSTINVNKSIENGKTPLFMACAGGHEKIVTMLLGAQGIDVNKESEEGETPLYAACAQNRGYIVSLLLQKTSSKIDVNKCTKDGFSPLYEACCQKNFDIVLMLLKQTKIDVNVSTNDGETPLYKACFLDCRDIVSILLEYSFDPIYINKGSIFGVTPLIIASEKGYDNIVRLLLENKELKVNEYTDEGKTALYTACDKGHTNVVSLLLQSETQNVDVNIVCPKNDATAIYAACRNGHSTIVSLFLKYKASEIDFNRCKSLLYTACARGYKDIVSILLKTGKIDVNEVTFWGETPLFASCEKGVEEIVLTLIKITAETIDVNKSIDSGETPLYIACYNGHLNIVSTLITCRNIDVNKCTTIAKSQLIECNQGYTNKDDSTYTNKNKIDGNTEAGETPLYRACYNGNLNIVSTLLSCKNIDVNKCTTTGKSPLYIACYQGYTEIVTLLLEDNASKLDVNICTDNGETPLFVSCSGGHENIVRILLEQGADHMICTREGKLPISIAKEKNYTTISEMIFDHDKRDSTCD